VLCRLRKQQLGSVEQIVDAKIAQHILAGGVFRGLRGKVACVATWRIAILI